MGQEATPHVSGQPDSTPSMTHPWEIERPCRHSVTPCLDVRYKIVSTSICLLSTDTGMRNPITGSVCNEVESQLSLFVSPVPDPSAMGVGALSMSWKALWAYAYPPPALLPWMLEKTQQDQCELILIATPWPQAMWFPLLLGMLAQSPLRIPNILQLL